MPESYFVLATNGRGKRVEVFQPNIGAARVTRQRLIDEGLTDTLIEFWDHVGERTVLE